MNKHLNIFKSYAKSNRSDQLENDLTRALAICLQEDTLFFHEVLKAIIDDVGVYNRIFEDLDGDSKLEIDIQKKTSKINEFEKVFAVSLSESLMSEFWQQAHNSEYDPICDLVISIDDILIVMEAKRDNVDCTAQLYNQILNIFNSQQKKMGDYKEAVTPFDLNWKKLMAIAVRVASFEKVTANSNRFLTDFIQLVKDHNFSWLPETPIGSLKTISRNSIYRRVESALAEFCNESTSVEKLPYRDRLGTTFSKNWANELLFEIDADSGDLVVEVYPGNTKGQGYHIFYKDPKLNESLEIDGDLYTTGVCYHIKFMGQSYITGLWITDDDFIKPLYTKKNFDKYTGRVKRNNWDVIESVLDQHISSDWKNQCKWQDKVINSNRSQFSISFGYRISIRIPLHKLKRLDVIQNDIAPLANFLGSIYTAFEEKLINEFAS